MLLNSFGNKIDWRKSVTHVFWIELKNRIRKEWIGVVFWIVVYLHCCFCYVNRSQDKHARDNQCGRWWRDELVGKHESFCSSPTRDGRAKTNEPNTIWFVTIFQRKNNKSNDSAVCNSKSEWSNTKSYSPSAVCKSNYGPNHPSGCTFQGKRKESVWQDIISILSIIIAT